MSELAIEDRATFAGLIDALRARFGGARATGRTVTVTVGGRTVELACMLVGAGEEWAAITAAGTIGPAPRRYLGLGTVVDGALGWGVRLVLPVAPLDPSAFADAMTRLASEASALARHQQRAVTRVADVYAGQF